MQLALFVLLPLAPCYLALEAQKLHALLLCMPDDPAYGTADAHPDGFVNGGAAPGAASCASLARVPTGVDLLAESAVLPAVGYIVGWSILVAVAAVGRMLLAYALSAYAAERGGSWLFADAPCLELLARIGELVHAGASVVFGALLACQLLLACSYASMVVAWHTLESCALPSHLLRQVSK